MNTSYKCSDSIKHGLHYLAKNQHTNGSFSSWRSSNSNDFSDHTIHCTTFMASVIGICLSASTEPIAQSIVSRAAIYVRGEMHENGTWNYWDSRSAEYLNASLPNDLDDTFCALRIIHHVAQLNGTQIAQLTQALFDTETTPGGPYRTWCGVGPDKRWSDVDIVVNANVGTLLKQINVQLPGLDAYIFEHVSRAVFSSQYYTNDIVVCYFLAHYYASTSCSELVEIIRLHKPINILEAALRTSALLLLKYYGKDIHTGVASIVAAQKSDGSWPAYGLYVDAQNTGERQYAGSPSLTTALCIEAMTLFQNFDSPKDEVAKSIPPTAVLRNINTVANMRLRNELKKLYDSAVTTNEHRNIVGMPQIVSQSLHGTVPQSFLKCLESVSIWGWMAYTQLDEVMDIKGNLKGVPASVYCLRQLHKSLQALLPEDAEFQNRISDILTNIDSANLWELDHCRLESVAKIPNYTDLHQLSDHSYGHAIAGLAILRHAGYEMNSLAAISYEEFFRNYLIARQLNDDVHDWEYDLNSGHINAVVVLLASEMRLSLTDIKEPGVHEAISAYLWQHGIASVSALICKHLQNAKEALGNCTDLSPHALLCLLEPIYASVNASYANQQSAKEFLSYLTDDSVLLERRTQL